MRNPLQYVFLAIIVFAFFSQFGKSIKDYLNFFDPDLATTPLAIIDEPLRFQYFMYMAITMSLAAIAYVLFKKFSHNTRAVLISVVFVAGIIVAMFSMTSSRNIADKVMSSQNAGNYQYCLFMTTKSTAMRATSTPSYYVYARTPAACTELLAVEPAQGYETHRALKQAVDSINARYN